MELQNFLNMVRLFHLYIVIIGYEDEKLKCLYRLKLNKWVLPGGTLKLIDQQTDTTVTDFRKRTYGRV
jgi:hypothetical protein